MKDIIETPFSKKKLYVGIIGSLMFVVAGVWLFSNADLYQKFPLEFMRNSIVIEAVGVIGILFFGLTGIIGIKKLFDKKAGLIINSDGIIDNSNGLSVGLIEWSDILEIRVKRVLTNKFLLIDIADPEKYIGKAKSGMKARGMRSNMKMYGTPLSIISNTLKYNFGELETVVQTEFEKYKSRR